jgi:RNA-directed DNA polymerase
VVPEGWRREASPYPDQSPVSQEAGPLVLYLWRQRRTGQNRLKELCHRGISKFNAAVAAGSPTGIWRMSGHPSVQQALRNSYFDSPGLSCIYAPAQA